MKTCVVLDEKKVALAKKLAGSMTLKALLDKALDEFISKSRRKSMLGLLSKGGFMDPSYKPLRKDRGRTHR